jgi:hypothetical protein
MYGNRSRAARVGVASGYRSTGDWTICRSKKLKLIRTLCMAGESQLGVNPQFNKSVPQRMIDCVSPLGFYIIKSLIIYVVSRLYGYLALK